MTSGSTRTHCFLCSPEPRWTWLTSRHFRAVLGLGPIGRGYSVIATREHHPSMLDLDSDLVGELEEFTRQVRNRLLPVGGPAVIAEHGRVAACVAPAVARHEPHCMHAHRLVFPGVPAFDLQAVAPLMPVERFDSFALMHRKTRWPGHYLYVEPADGQAQLGLVEGPLPRQFLRFIAAQRLGTPQLADWRSNPQPEYLDQAREEIGYDLLAA